MIIAELDYILNGLRVATITDLDCILSEYRAATETALGGILKIFKAKGTGGQGLREEM